jgi:Zn ribbon nucleic-acid-binding protein
MSTTLLETTKSKRACPSCKENKLVTNDAEKFDEVVYNHCLNCGYEFPENEQQRKFRDSKEKAEKGETSWNTGIALLLAMGATILAIKLTQSNPTFNEPEPVQLGVEMPFVQP